MPPLPKKVQVNTDSQSSSLILCLTPPEATTKPHNSSKSSNNASSDTESNAKSIALNSLPEWCDKNKIGTTMNKRKKRTSIETNCDNFLQRSMKKFANENYKAAFKIATKQLHQNQSGPNSGKKGYGAIAICKQLNQELLHHPSDKQLKPTTIQTAVDHGLVGVSPFKKGRPEKIPQQFTKALATHTTMLQVTAGEGKASGKK